MQFSTSLLLLGALSISSVSADVGARLIKPRDAAPVPFFDAPIENGAFHSPNPAMLARRLICGSGKTCTEACASCGPTIFWCGTKTSGSCDCADTNPATGRTCPGGSVAPPATSTTKAPATSVISTVTPGSTEYCGRGKTCEAACGTCGPGSGWCGSMTEGFCDCYESGDTCCLNGSTCRSGTFCAVSGEYCCTNGLTVAQCAGIQGFSVPPGQGTLTSGPTRVSSASISVQTDTVLSTDDILLSTSSTRRTTTSSTTLSSSSAASSRSAISTIPTSSTTSRASAAASTSATTGGSGGARVKGEVGMGLVWGVMGVVGLALLGGIAL